MAREDQTKITDDGSLHEFLTAIPNSVIRGQHSQDLSVHAKWLYVYLKSVAGKSGECFQSTRIVAKGAGMSLAAVYAAKQDLQKANLIILETGKRGVGGTDHIRIKDIWAANMQEFARDVRLANKVECDGFLMDAEENDGVVRLANKVDESCSLGEQSCSLGEQTLPSPSDSPSQDLKTQDPEREKTKEKETPSVSTNVETSPPTPARQTQSPASKLQPMPQDEPGQETLKATIVDQAMAIWQQKNYSDVDVEAQWEHFVNQCLSRDYRYANFRRAFMNSFAWGNSPAQRKQTKSHQLTYAEKRKAAEDKSNRELEDMVYGRFTGDSPWQTLRRDGADLPRDAPGYGRESRLLDGPR